jgi:hypothetical protein
MGVLHHTTHPLPSQLHKNGRQGTRGETGARRPRKPRIARQHALNRFREVHRCQVAATSAGLHPYRRVHARRACNLIVAAA